jgi:hypothetical protein
MNQIVAHFKKGGYLIDGFSSRVPGLSHLGRGPVNTGAWLSLTLAGRSAIFMKKYGIGNRIQLGEKQWHRQKPIKAQAITSFPMN